MKTPVTGNLDKLQVISTHVAVSAPIASNIPGFTETKFILSRDSKDLCNQIFTYFDQLSQKANKLMYAKFKYILDSPLKPKNLGKIKDYCSSLPILGFSSGFYDIGLLSHEGFIIQLVNRDSNPFIIRDGNRYKVIKTKQFVFLDQMSYCAAGISLNKSFLKSMTLK